jgi:hypothetical protein
MDNFFKAVLSLVFTPLPVVFKLLVSVVKEAGKHLALDIP